MICFNGMHCGTDDGVVKWLEFGLAMEDDVGGEFHRHGARFDVTTGEALTAPAYEDLTTFEVRVDDGMVMVNPESDD